MNVTAGVDIGVCFCASSPGTAISYKDRWFLYVFNQAIKVCLRLEQSRFSLSKAVSF
jgi:hypothetical protein